MKKIEPEQFISDYIINLTPQFRAFVKKSIQSCCNCHIKWHLDFLMPMFEGDEMVRVKAIIKKKGTKIKTIVAAYSVAFDTDKEPNIELLNKGFERIVIDREIDFYQPELTADYANLKGIMFFRAICENPDNTPINFEENYLAKLDELQNYIMSHRKAYSKKKVLSVTDDFDNILFTLKKSTEIVLSKLNFHMCNNPVSSQIERWLSKEFHYDIYGKYNTEY